MAKKVPLIISAPPPDFGEHTSDSAFDDPHGANHDLSYVPGFGDLRRRRDREVLEVARGERRPQDCITLPVNMRWARMQDKAGTPDNRKVFSHARVGYRMATSADIGQEWLRELPPGASLGADGTIRQGDTVLMVTDAQHAARNASEKQRRTKGQVDATAANFEDSVPGGFVESKVEKKP